MEAAVRWPLDYSRGSRNFLITDVSANSIEHCQVTSVQGTVVEYEQLSKRDKLPNFTAFDWSKSDDNIVAIGTSAGDAKVVRLNDPSGSDFTHSFSVKLQRRCNSIAFNRQHLIATGHDRARNDPSLNVYDASYNGASTAHRRMATSEIVSNVKFFGDQPDLLLAGVARQCIRLYDLRDASANAAQQFTTRQVHFLSIDPLDENYFASVAPSGENSISVWDRRLVTIQSTAVLEIKNPIDSSLGANVWSLRYSGYTRGAFALLSSQGQVRMFNTSTFSDDTLYTKVSHDLHPPVQSPDDKTARPIAFDFADSSALSQSTGILTIQQLRSSPEQRRRLELLSIPRQPPHRPLVLVDIPSKRCTDSTIAGDLEAIQAQYGSTAGVDGMDARIEATHRSRIDYSMTKISSFERHEDLLSYHRLKPSEVLTILDIARRRCKEGYLFDCGRNREIVRDDPWLVDLWNLIRRFEFMASNDGMVYETLDLSFLGVYGIWNSKLGSRAHRVVEKRSSSRLVEMRSIPRMDTAIVSILFRMDCGRFEGVKTEFPEHRQLGLAICGWKFDEKDLRSKCSEILSRREYYKAIVVAVCHGRKDIAIDLLRSLTKTKVIENTSIAAVIACETVSEEQRSMCEWMAEEAEDPYLKALLAYFISGDWYTVVAMAELPLAYRVAVALKFLDDTRLTKFIDTTTREAIAKGDTEGVVLTGLTEQAMDLFQNYISRHGDIQTAVLAMAFVNPMYIVDPRWESWKEQYFDEMQAWKAFLERTRFTIQHTRRGASMEAKRLVKPPPRQVTLRCLHCQQSLAHSEFLSDSLNGDGNGNGPRSKPQNDNVGVSCPKCGRRLPRCCICMHWLGSPDPARSAIAHEMERDDKMAKFTTFCANCNHASHAHHAREWFSKHLVCPVPDCTCTCAQRH